MSQANNNNNNNNMQRRNLPGVGNMSNEASNVRPRAQIPVRAIQPMNINGYPAMAMHGNYYGMPQGPPGNMPMNAVAPTFWSTDRNSNWQVYRSTPISIQNRHLHSDPYDSGSESELDYIFDSSPPLHGIRLYNPMYEPPAGSEATGNAATPAASANVARANATAIATANALAYASGHAGPYAPVSGPTYGPVGGPRYGPPYGPASAPTYAPANGPGYAPTNGATYAPANGPGYAPTNGATYAPANGPGYAPTNGPGYAPTNGPGNAPTNGPGYAPTNGPGYAPTNGPGYAPTNGPGYAPTSGQGLPPYRQVCPQMRQAMHMLSSGRNNMGSNNWREYQSHVRAINRRNASHPLPGTIGAVAPMRHGAIGMERMRGGVIGTMPRTANGMRNMGGCFGNTNGQFVSGIAISARGPHRHPGTRRVHRIYDPELGDFVYFPETESDDEPSLSPLAMVPRQGNSVSDLSQCSADEDTKSRP